MDNLQGSRLGYPLNNPLTHQLCDLLHNRRNNPIECRLLNRFIYHQTNQQSNRLDNRQINPLISRPCSRAPALPHTLLFSQVYSPQLFLRSNQVANRELIQVTNQPHARLLNRSSILRDNHSSDHHGNQRQDLLFNLLNSLQ